MSERMKRILEIERELGQLLTDADRMRRQVTSALGTFSVSKMNGNVIKDAKTLAECDVDTALQRMTALVEIVTQTKALLSERRELEAASDE